MNGLRIKWDDKYKIGIMHKQVRQHVILYVVNVFSVFSQLYTHESWGDNQLWIQRLNIAPSKEVIVTILKTTLALNHFIPIHTIALLWFSFHPHFLHSCLYVRELKIRHHTWPTHCMFLYLGWRLLENRDCSSLTLYTWVQLLLRSPSWGFAELK